MIKSLNVMQLHYSICVAMLTKKVYIFITATKESKIYWD